MIFESLDEKVDSDEIFLNWIASEGEGSKISDLGVSNLPITNASLNNIVVEKLKKGGARKFNDMKLNKKMIHVICKGHKEMLSYPTKEINDLSIRTHVCLQDKSMMDFFIIWTSKRSQKKVTTIFTKAWFKT